MTHISNIQKSAVLVKLGIRQWGGQKVDKSATLETCTAKNADNNAGKFVKSLMGGSQLLKEIKQVSSAARHANNAQTLPFTTGVSLLPVTNFERHSELLQGHQQMFTSLVSEFIDEFEVMRDRQSLRLGEMFNIYDYPSVSELWTRFQFDLSYEPLADNNAFDNMLGSVEMEQQLIETANRQMQSRIDDAVTELWSRLTKAVVHVEDKLRNYKPADGEVKAEGAFRDTLIQNVRDLCDVLPRLNLTGDADLDNACQLVSEKIAVYDCEDLRSNDNLRKSVADDAQSILDTMQGVYGLAAE